MSAGGSLNAMNKTISANRALVKKISAFEKLKKYESTSKSKKRTYNYVPATPEQLAAVKSKLAKQQKVALIKKIAVFSFSVVITVLLIYLALQYFGMTW
ncbi:MAG: hypothetical protein AAFX87_29800 [Bacteroidota bacterium]